MRKAIKIAVNGANDYLEDSGSLKLNGKNDYIVNLLPKILHPHVVCCMFSEVPKATS